MRIEWKSLGREHLVLDLVIDGEQIKDAKMHAIGSLPFLRLSQQMKRSLKGARKDLTPPEGVNPPALIWREVIKRIQGQWKLPVEHDELCHCRKVATYKVDEAIVYGAHNVGEIRKQTSANTGCGTCLPDVVAMIKNRI